MNTEDKMKTYSSTEGVSQFVESLIKNGIVSRSLVEKAIQFKQSLDNSDKRQLFKILIDEFNVDREKIFQHFTEYYSFKTINFQQIGQDKSIITFIIKVLERLPKTVIDQALEAKVLPFQVSENDPNKLIVVTPDPSNTDVPIISRLFQYPKNEIFYIPSVKYEELLHYLSIDKLFYSEAGDEIMDEEEILLGSSLDNEVVMFSENLNNCLIKIKHEIFCEMSH